MRARASLLATVLLVAACGSSGVDIDPTPRPTEAGFITEAAYGSAWPFTKPSGVLRCVESAGRPLVTFSPGDGIEYALNGAAIDFGFPELDATILTDFPDKTGVLPLIEQALEDC